MDIGCEDVPDAGGGIERRHNIMRKSLIILIGLLFVVGFATICNAEIYKWVDEKGTIHFTEDPSTIPEKYKEKTQSRTTEEDLMPLEQQIRLREKEEAELRERLKREKNEAEIRKLKEQLKKVSESVEKERREAERKREEANRAPSPGYIPFEKFKHVTKGMTEAEVLSRFGPPTRIEEDEVRSEGAITGHVSPGGTLRARLNGEALVVKRYYYIGDRSKGEQTRIIIFEKGKVVNYESIYP